MDASLSVRPQRMTILHHHHHLFAQNTIKVDYGYVNEQDRTFKLGGGVRSGQSGQAVKLFQTPRKISSTFQFCTRLASNKLLVSDSGADLHGSHDPVSGNC